MFRNLKQLGVMVSFALVAAMLWMSGSAAVAQRGDLRALVDKEDVEFLLSEIQQIHPNYAIRQLARFQQMQNKVGGGFCGCLAEQLMNADEIPLPVDKAGVLVARSARSVVTWRGSSLNAMGHWR